VGRPTLAQSGGLASFAHARPIRVRARSEPRFDGGEVTRRARSRLGEDCYRILGNNCEHFCEWYLKVALGELPPSSRFLQIALFELGHHLTWDSRTRLDEGSLATQVRNRSDVSFATHGFSVRLWRADCEQGVEDDNER
jgi:Lecithin retinol acyltransferase